MTRWLGLSPQRRPNDRQWVILTHWWVISPFQPQCRHKRPPTSHYDSLVASPTTTPAQTTANESFWLVGGLSFPSNHDAGTNDHQRVITTRWLGLPPRRRPTLTCIYRYTTQRRWQTTIRGTCRTTTTTITMQGGLRCVKPQVCKFFMYYYLLLS